MKNKIIYGIVYAGSVLAGVILFFAERRYRKERKNNKG